ARAEIAVRRARGGLSRRADGRYKGRDLAEQAPLGLDLRGQRSLRPFDARSDVVEKVDDADRLAARIGIRHVWDHVHAHGRDDAVDETLERNVHDARSMADSTCRSMRGICAAMPAMRRSLKPRRAKQSVAP